MSDDSSSLLEEERSLFRPFTRESLLAIEARISDELERQKEIEKRKAEGEVRDESFQATFQFPGISGVQNLISDSSDEVSFLHDANFIFLSNRSFISR